MLHWNSLLWEFLWSCIASHSDFYTVFLAAVWLGQSLVAYCIWCNKTFFFDAARGKINKPYNPETFNSGVEAGVSVTVWEKLERHLHSFRWEQSGPALTNSLIFPASCSVMLKTRKLDHAIAVLELDNETCILQFIHSTFLDFVQAFLEHQQLVARRL